MFFFSGYFTPFVASPSPFLSRASAVEPGSNFLPFTILDIPCSFPLDPGQILARSRKAPLPSSMLARKTMPRKGKTARTAKPAAKDGVSIAQFARVSKSTENRKDRGKALATASSTSVSRKRKADDDLRLVDASSSGPGKKSRLDPSKPLVEITNSSRKRAISCGAKVHVSDNTPTSSSTSSKRKRRDASPTPGNSAVSVDATQAEILLERLNLQGSPIRKRVKTAASTSLAQHGEDLPLELQDLVRLQAVLLKTLSMQHAHNGVATPVDVRSLCPHISRAWGKREVMVEDIRRCIGIMSWTPEPVETHETAVSLTDYGRGKLCIELHSTGSVNLLQERDLNKTFAANLRKLWAAREDANMQWFLASLPKAVIKAGTSMHVPPVIANGRRAMAEMREALALKQREKEDAQKSRQQTSTNADGSKMSLLDRIRVKELQQAQAPQGPTPEQIQRRTAMQRVEDVAAVLGMLVAATAVGRPRTSFTMQAFLTKLRDSLRVPISLEDGSNSVTLLAAEIAPQWLQIVKVGGRDNIVVQTAFQPSKQAIQEKVRILSV